MNAPHCCLMRTLSVLLIICSVKQYVPLNLVTTYLLLFLLFCGRIIVLIQWPGLKTVEGLLLLVLKSNFIPPENVYL
jgi:hypothetical protein